MLWVDWMDCSLADEHVLMRSASLLCVECLWLWLPDPEPAWIWFWFWFRTTATSPASPGKVNEPGRLAGEPGMELQKPEAFFWPGLGGGGGRPSLARGGSGAGGAPGRDLETGVEGRGPTAARGTGSAGGCCAWSSWCCRGRLARGPRGRREGRRSTSTVSSCTSTTALAEQKAAVLNRVQFQSAGFFIQ